jgi:HEAT repeat protein
MSSAFKEAAATIGEQTAAEFDDFANLVRAIGPSTVPALAAAYQREDGVATERITALIVAHGPPAIPLIAAALDDRPWFVQRELARALGKIRTSAAVPPLQSLLRRADPRVLQVAVASLSTIRDPAAERALHTVLRAATGEARAAVISALIALKEPGVVPMLGRVIQDSDPFGPDHPLILDTLGALATMRDDRALSQIALLARKKRWLAWGRTQQTRKACLDTLGKIGTAKARQAIGDLAKTGDFFLKRLAAKAAANA